jgi:hypothetical protein
VVSLEIILKLYVPGVNWLKSEAALKGMLETKIESLSKRKSKVEELGERLMNLYFDFPLSGTDKLSYVATETFVLLSARPAKKIEYTFLVFKKMGTETCLTALGGNVVSTFLIPALIKVYPVF